MFKWLWFKKQKEKPMAETTTASRTTRQLKKQIQQQNEEIAALRDRIGTLRDDMAVMTRTIATFQDKVQEDMTTVFDGLKTLSQR